METKEQIINKVKKYIVEVLEPVRPELSGFAACPFVKAERIKNKIMYDVLDGNSSLVEIAERFDKSNFSTAIIAQILPEGDSISPEEGLQYQSFINSLLEQIGLGEYKNICFNPMENINVNGFCPREKAPYFLINIAKKKELSRAHKSLLKTAYFDNFPDNYKKYLKVK